MKQLEFSISHWMDGKGPEIDIVISSRVRVARNLREYPYPCLASDAETTVILEKIKLSLSGIKAFGDFSFLTIEGLSAVEKQALVEKHLISPYLAAQSKHGALLLSNDEALSIMVNEEDHLRIQAILPGFQLEEAWQLANDCDDKIEKELDYAFSERYGYLTACPTNMGTGLRASVMLHLPALIVTRQFNRMLRTLPQVGLTIRGIYGEGTEIVGNLVQISNQVTLGHSEEEIISNLYSVTRQIIEQEQAARQALLDKDRDSLADKSWRALGLLKHARVMSSQEAIQLISDLRLGYDLGLIKAVDHRILNKLLILIRPGCLQLLSQKELGHHERNLERPVQIKKVLEHTQG